VLAVSHDLGFVAEAADRVVVMREGRIAEDRPVRELLWDAPALRGLGLRPPATVEVSVALRLGGRPVRTAEVVEGMRGVKWRQAPE
jgi:energy-coupling factor transporter ATP-binding protein EcfA2